MYELPHELRKDLKIQDLGKLRNFKKNTEIFGIGGEYTGGNAKGKF